MGKIFNIITTIILVLLIILFASVLIFTMISKGNNEKKAPSIFGYSVYQIVSGSMHPTLEVGEIIFVKKTAFNKIEKGDIITFLNANETAVITHRVFDIVDNKIITKGDYNTSPDTTPVVEKQLIGKVTTSLAVVGKFIMFFRSTLGLFILIVTPIVLIIISEFVKRSRREEKSVKLSSKTDNEDN